MKFDGHRLYTIGRDWAFDITTFNGYKVTKTKNGEIETVIKAFSVLRIDNEYKFKHDSIDVPAGVFRKTKQIIQNYMKEAMIDECPIK